MKERNKNNKIKSYGLDANIWFIPTTVILLLFTYYPLVYWLVAFYDYRIGSGLSGSNYVGLNHFADFFSSFDTWKGLLANTLIMNLGGLFVSVMMGLIISFFIQTMQSDSFQMILIFVSIIPFFISWASLSNIVNYFFGYNDGFMNNVLLHFGFNRINILGEPKYSWLLMISLTAWKESGFFILVFHSAMQSIPKEQYEVAEMAGASLLKKYSHITLPQIKGVIIIMLILEIGWAFSSDLDKYYLFTNPTNISSMEVLDMYIYRFGLKLGRFSYSAAVSIVKTILSSVLFVLSYSLTRIHKTINRGNNQ